MGKVLTFNKNIKKVEVNNSAVTEIAKQRFLDDITLAQPFQSLFPMEDIVLDAIVKDMEINGFDKSKPVNAWRKIDGPLVLIDGYTRFHAAKMSGITMIPVFENEFSNETEALEYAVKVQKNRRNLTDATLLLLVQKLDSPVVGSKKGLKAPHGAFKNTGNKTSEITAKKLGISTRKTERARVVLKNMELTNRVLAGELTINGAEKLTNSPVKNSKKSDSSDPIEKIYSLISGFDQTKSKTYWDGVLHTLEALRLCNVLDSTIQNKLRKKVEETVR